MATQPEKSGFWKRNWKWMVALALIFVDANAIATGTRGDGVLPALIGPTGWVLLIWGVVDWRRRARATSGDGRRGSAAGREHVVAEADTAQLGQHDIGDNTPSSSPSGERRRRWARPWAALVIAGVVVVMGVVWGVRVYRDRLRANESDKDLRAFSMCLERAQELGLDSQTGPGIDLCRVVHWDGRATSITDVENLLALRADFFDFYYPCIEQRRGHRPDYELVPSCIHSWLATTS